MFFLPRLTPEFGRQNNWYAGCRSWVGFAPVILLRHCNASFCAVLCWFHVLSLMCPCACVSWTGTESVCYGVWSLSDVVVWYVSGVVCQCGMQQMYVILVLCGRMLSCASVMEIMLYFVTCYFALFLGLLRHTPCWKTNSIHLSEMKSTEI